MAYLLKGSKMDVMASLKEATWDVHLRLEKRLDIKGRFSDLASYGEHIALLLAFYGSAETEWAGLLEPALEDYPARRKAHLLADDLLAVGGTAIAGAVVPTVTDTASAMGAFYVLEGATLGGQHLLPLAAHKLGLSPANGASYLASYGSQVGHMWRVFGAAVQFQGQIPGAAAKAAAAARTTFLAMETWLTGVQA